MGKNFSRVGDDSDTRAALLPLPCARANAAQRQSGFDFVVVMFAAAGSLRGAGADSAVIPVLADFAD